MIYLILLIVAGLVFALVVTRYNKKEEPKKMDDRPADCCGAHEVCESESLLNSSEEIVYYDDEELDVYICKPGNSYNDNEIDQFREILLTLQEKEVAAWLRSLQMRGIIPPDIVKEEALMIVAERRAHF